MKQTLYIWLDIADDGIRNDSPKLKLPPHLPLIAGLALGSVLTSCTYLTPPRTRALAEVGLAILESRGHVTPRDADDIRRVGAELLPLQELPTK